MDSQHLFEKTLFIYIVTYFASNGSNEIVMILLLLL